MWPVDPALVQHNCARTIFVQQSRDLAAPFEATSNAEVIFADAVGGRSDLTVCVGDPARKTCDALAGPGQLVS